MNAALTWWGVSIALVNHQSLGGSVVAQGTLVKVVPIFVAVMVWLIRILIIGTFSVAGDRLFSQADARRTTRPATSLSSSARSSSRSLNPTPTTFRPVPKLSTQANRSAPYTRPEPTYHPVSMSSNTNRTPQTGGNKTKTPLPRKRGEGLRVRGLIGDSAFFCVLCGKGHSFLCALCNRLCSLLRHHAQLVHLQIRIQSRIPGKVTAHPLALAADRSNILDGMQRIARQHHILHPPHDLAVLDLIAQEDVHRELAVDRVALPQPQEFVHQQPLADSLEHLSVGGITRTDHQVAEAARRAVPGGFDSALPGSIQVIDEVAQHTVLDQGQFRLRHALIVKGSGLRSIIQQRVICQGEARVGDGLSQLARQR